MDELDAGRDYLAKEEELLQLLTQLAAFLQQYGEDRWARHFDHVGRELTAAIHGAAPRSKKAAIGAMLRSVYGGMGSFGDVVIHDAGGSEMDRPINSAINEQLWALANRVYDLSLIYQESRYADQEH